jgi:hypothetical protein
MIFIPYKIVAHPLGGPLPKNVSAPRNTEKHDTTSTT